MLTQSAWLTFANVIGGALMWAVHLLAKEIPPAEYGLFGAYLAVAMLVPGLPLQSVMAHQTALAVTANQLGPLASKMRLVLLSTFMVWLSLLVALFYLNDWIRDQWAITNIVGLYITAGALILSIWLPLLSGVLQGLQAFTHLGWTMIINGTGRLGFATVSVMTFGSYAAGMMLGVLIGLGLAVSAAFWRTRAIWLTPSKFISWPGMTSQVAPAIIGFSALVFIATADTIFVKAMYEGSESGYYLSAGTLSRAVLWLVAPFAAVMFAKIAYQADLRERQVYLSSALKGTTLIAVTASTYLATFGAELISAVWGHEYVAFASEILPWYAFAMTLLSIGNVLLSYQIAKNEYGVIPALLVIAISYGCSLAFSQNLIANAPKLLLAFSAAFFAINAYYVLVNSAANRNELKTIK